MPKPRLSRTNPPPYIQFQPPLKTSNQKLHSSCELNPSSHRHMPPKKRIRKWYVLQPVMSYFFGLRVYAYINIYIYIYIKILIGGLSGIYILKYLTWNSKFKLIEIPSWTLPSLGRITVGSVNKQYYKEMSRIFLCSPYGKQRFSSNIFQSE